VTAILPCPATTPITVPPPDMTIWSGNVTCRGRGCPRGTKRLVGIFGITRLGGSVTGGWATGPELNAIAICTFTGTAPTRFVDQVGTTLASTRCVRDGARPVPSCSDEWRVRQLRAGEMRPAL